MIEFNDFIKEVNKKFQDELWADFESKFFGDNLFIRPLAKIFIPSH